MVNLTELPRPFVIAVVVERGTAAATRAASRAFRDGADAVELNLASLPAAGLPGRAFYACLRGPVYGSCRRAPFMRVYGARFARLPVLADEVRIERQLLQLKHGAAGLDLEADTFAPNADEWTKDRSAIRRQSAVAYAAHQLGRAVIFSWHPPRKLAFTEARRAVLALRARGADFVKIVVRVAGIDDALDALRISQRLHDTLGGPLVFLPLGPGAERVRPFVTSFGAAYLLARPAVGANRLAAQPLVARARLLIDSV